MGKRAKHGADRRTGRAGPHRVRETRGTARGPDRPEPVGLLAQVAEDLGAGQALDASLSRVVEHLRSTLPCRVLRLLLWDDTTRRLEPRIVVGLPSDDPRAAGCPLGRGIPGVAAALRRTVSVADVLSDDRYVGETPPDADSRAVVAVPVLFRDRLLGVLELRSATAAAFDERHERLLGAVAAQIAVALDYARIEDVTERQRRHLEGDLAMAGEIQRCLLLGDVARVEGVDVGTSYLPVAALGGDFFDFLTLGDDRLVIAVGDVAGKGTPAALYGALTVGMMRGHVLDRSLAPAELLHRLNLQLNRPAIDNRFVALAFGVFDAADRTLTLANAGFTEPILMRGGHLERIRVRGVPLGLLPDIRYDETRLPLKRRDIVAFVSDGLQEAIDGQGQQFGERFLEDVLRALSSEPARWIAEGLLRASTAYAGENEERPDDRSVVVLKVL